MASDELQNLVEALSLALDFPVLLDDAALVPIAYSRQWGAIDAVRTDSIFGRRATARVRDALLGQGIAKATSAVRVPRIAELEMDERVCVPVRAHGVTYGFFWLVDPERTLDDAAIARVEQAATRAAELLAGRPDPPLHDETSLVAALCSPAEAEREQAVEEVVRSGRIGDRPLVAVRVAPAGHAPVRLGDLARRITHRVSQGHALAGRIASGLLVLLDLDDPALGVLDTAMLARWVHQASDAPVAVGQSGVLGGPGETPEGRRQAELALRVARTRPPGETYAAWDRLGAGRLVAQLPTSARGDVPIELQRLIATDTALADTLEAFLDAGGDVKRTAATLSMHRSGLYYRLQRIEEATGLDLREGDDRLLAHLALRVLRHPS